MSPLIAFRGQRAGAGLAPTSTLAWRSRSCAGDDMQLSSDSVSHQAPIPPDCAFCMPDAEQRLRPGGHRNPALPWRRRASSESIA